MKTFVLFSFVALETFSLATVEAQKSENENLTPAKIISYNQDGSVKIIINKEKVDRFYSIPVDEDYLSWYEMCSKYDWPTIRFVLQVHKSAEININSRSDVERIAYTYKKMVGTLYDPETQKPKKDRPKAPLPSDIKLPE